MGLLDSFEKGLERAVNGAFAKTFRSGIQPVEIASALRSELDKKAAVVARDRILAPNTFTVRLAPADDERMQAIGQPLVDEARTLTGIYLRRPRFRNHSSRRRPLDRHAAGRLVDRTRLGVMARRT